MASNLLIVESPAKAKTLKKYLGNDFEVLATFGHVRDLIPKTGAIDTENNFAMQYETIARNSKHVDAIAKAAAAADHIYLATDPDREGEAIAWHVAELLKAKRNLKNKSMQRVVFYEITQNAVKEAVANPRDIAIPLVNAQQARRALDYLVGFNLSPLLWRKIRPGLSAGRVQSPALRLIVERELEIEAFRAQEYWSVHLDSQKNKLPFSAKLFQYQGKKLEQLSIGGEAAYQKIYDTLNAAKLPPRVVRVDKKAKQRYAAAPFTTSTLQQEGVRKLGMSADRVMRIAQQLYEGIDIGGQAIGLISYMRTDSVNLAQEAINEIRGYISSGFSADYLPRTVPVYKSKAKNAQEAHEAIRPTSISRTPDSIRDALTVDQARLYEMIWKRTLASQMTPARFDTVSVDIRLGGDDTLFRASGQTLVFPGFIAVYQEDTDDSNDDEEGGKLPPLEEGDVLPLDKLYGEQHFTQPPPRYTEASLVKTLEEHGIGRPSTYASIISTLQAREYALLEKKRFTPTDVGRVVNRFLSEHFTRYVDYGFTAQMEDELDEISEGKRDWIPVLDAFWKDFAKLVEEKKSIERKDVTQELLDEACPKCGKPLSTRLGKRGSFIGCTAYPECDYTRSTTGEIDPKDARKELGNDPATNMPVLLLRGPYGYYVQLGEVEEGAKKKPRRMSWPKEVPPENADLPTALKLLELPKEIGNHPESGKKVIVNIGRFGPYIGHDGKFKSIPKTESVFTITLDRAVELLAEARTSNTVLRELGPHPEDKKPVDVCNGRYGPYVRHGKVNATLPKDVSPDEITLEEALPLLAARVAKGPVSKKRVAAKKPAAAKKDVATQKAPTAKKKAVTKKVVIEAETPIAKKKAAVKKKTVTKTKVTKKASA
ncbi:MAG: DNA topoisomerase I [Gallionellales bacterium 35-53-114]|jgi:DNA topoisomerase-1|nr:MAG: DNA topoisomerase I [Gallionellales bacterium 35-53-114]OYZ63566.1 MAG: DNA topoisomerase I [Gallionellales bacterium 24-53-125]OZB10824.1 MAG: DNA topoisomerase I [Gallionellales bacterium 39-52-133]HQS59002.1 type I DNA topoisomerase [Gallionellaceae bacterium]HQS75613.1 type I DNA topoisomerase [Gallionellaceae bacterium]